jgi:hypothetical protein
MSITACAVQLLFHLSSHLVARDENYRVCVCNLEGLLADSDGADGYLLVRDWEVYGGERDNGMGDDQF